MDAPEKPIARWLRVSREAQRMDDAEGNSVPWTHKHLLELMAEQIEWAPPHSNYSKYESGKATPKPTTLNKFKRFWKLYGVDGPDLTTPPVVEPPVDPAIAAIRDQTDAIKALVGELLRWRTKDRDRIADLELTVARLAGSALDGPEMPGRAKPRVPDGTKE